MRKIFILLAILITFTINAETLFEVKDASNNKVLDVSTDGLRVMNQGDTLMVISSSEIKAVLESSKGLSRSFSVTTTSSTKGSANDVMRITGDSTRFWISDTGSGFGVSKRNLGKKGIETNVLEVNTGSTTMREGDLGDQYTNFSPENIFVGLKSGIETTPGIPYEFSGVNNVFLGNETGMANINGTANVFIGVQAGKSNISGSNNTLIGAGSGSLNTVDGNVFIGNSAGFYSRTGEDNIFIGVRAGGSNDLGSSNVFIGAAAGYGGNQYSSVGTGNDNIFIGDSCAYKSLHGNRNVFLGAKSGLNNISGTGNIFLGYKAGLNHTGSNRLFIDNSDTASPLIYGEFDNNLIMINGKLGVGASPLYKIHSVDATTGVDDAAVYGKHAVTDCYGIGVQGEGGYRGVFGFASASAYNCHGIHGEATGTGGVKVGVYGIASGGGINWAGYFDGDVNVIGTVVKSKDEIKIDHPQDPTNKVLTHAGVNSDELTNIYNGNVILNSYGEGVVILPNWFESLNSDFRYQLTPVGKPAPDLYISEEIKNNSFRISGGSPNMKVSWQVTCVRNDNYAKSNPVKVETEKEGNQKGLYINPEVYGYSRDKSIEKAMDKDRNSDK